MNDDIDRSCECDVPQRHAGECPTKARRLQKKAAAEAELKPLETALRQLAERDRAENDRRVRREALDEAIAALDAEVPALRRRVRPDGKSALESLRARLLALRDR